MIEMTLTLTPERLQLAYDFLAGCPPFDGWNMPAGEDVGFRRCRMKGWRGWYCLYVRGPKKGKHIIAISPKHVRTLEELMATMAHEMVHLHERSTEMNTRAQHTKAFMILSRRICKIFGFEREIL